MHTTQCEPHKSHSLRDQEGDHCENLSFHQNSEDISFSLWCRQLLLMSDYSTLIYAETTFVAGCHVMTMESPKVKTLTVRAPPEPEDPKSCKMQK